MTFIYNKKYKRKDRMRTKIATVLGIICVVGLTGLCVHKYDNWNAANKAAARQQAAINDRENEARAAEARAKATEETATYKACVASQEAFDAQAAAVRAKNIRPVCTTPVAQ